MLSLSDLAVETDRTLALFSCVLKDRHKNRYKKRNDCYDHKKLDEGKSCRIRKLSSNRPGWESSA